MSKKIPSKAEVLALSIPAGRWVNTLADQRSLGALMLLGTGIKKVGLVE